MLKITHYKKEPEEEPKPMRELKWTLDDLKTDIFAIFRTQTHSRITDAMMIEIMRQVDAIPGVTYEFDDYGNMYATKGKLAKDEAYPIFVCHTDTVHKIYDVPLNINISENGNIYGYVEPNGEFMQAGVGGDDKCGIIACIEMLHRLKKVKCAFFLDEEVGCVGSSNGKLEFFEDGRYAIQVDRKGNGDIITNGSGTRLCSKEFEEMMNELGKNYSYSSTNGMMTDVVKLKNRGLNISACNLSAGYFNPHTKQEVVNVWGLLNCLEFCMAIAMIKTKYPHEQEKTTYQGNYAGYVGHSRGGYSSESRVNARTNYSKPKSIRQCSECDGALELTESKVCQACVHTWFETTFLREDTESGKQTILVVEDIALPKGWEQWLPSDHCLLCESNKHKGKKVVLETQSQKKRGYCDDCLICSECDKFLTTGEELSLGMHQEHLPISELDYCTNEGCTTALMSENEQSAGQCENCIAQFHAI